MKKARRVPDSREFLDGHKPILDDIMLVGNDGLAALGPMRASNPSTAGSTNASPPSFVRLSFATS